MSTNIYFIGSYTEVLGHAPQGCGKGIYTVTQNRDSGALNLVSTAGGIVNPSWLHWDMNRKTLYCITENEENGGEIATFKYNDSQSLFESARMKGSGRASCHLLTHKQKDLLFTVSYLDGSMSSYQLKESFPDALKTVFQYEGEGPVSGRQEGPHAHQLCLNAAGDILYVCDLGSDRIWMHDLLSPDFKQSTALVVPSGYGPRHMAVDPQSLLVYILCELQPKLLVAGISENGQGRMDLLEEHHTVDESQIKIAAPAAIKIHPSGKTVYVSNRFTDSLSVFEINRNSDTGILNKVDEFGCQGKTPRDFSFSPDGCWLLIANQDSSDIQCRRIDSETGLPGDDWTQGLTLGTPVCIAPLFI